MLSPEVLSQLESDCTAVARDSWDGSVEVVQDTNGVITVTSFTEDDEAETEMTLSPYGEALGGEELWQVHEVGVDYAAGQKPVITLVPKVICGLLGL